ncbi:hypothetical protein ACJJTC_012483 [Scirpophaga incertulas]
MMLYITKTEEVPVKRPPRRRYVSANIKRHHAGISQSSCSDGSLLSVGSSEMDEDSSSGHHHSHDHSTRSDHSDFYNSSEPPSGVAPLSHSAARHKMAVRPRRTHGAPRRKKNIPIAASALPITPELNEEMIRSTTPEVIHKTSEVVTESLSSAITTKHTVKEQQVQISRELQRVSAETKLKSSSLPPGLALSRGMAPPRPTSPLQDQSPQSPISHGALSLSTVVLGFYLGKAVKKPKKETEERRDVKKKVEKTQYKLVDTEKNYEGSKPIPAERTHKTTGQKVFANQMHKRLDDKGGYMQEGAYKDVYSAAKVPGVEYNITDLKIADETDKMLNMEIRSRFSRRDEFIEKTEWKRCSKEIVEERRESFSLNHDRSRRPASVQRLMEPSQAFISEEIMNRAKEEVISPTLMISDEEPSIRPRIKSVHSDYTFNSGSMPKNIPYYNPGLSVPSSPPKTRHQSSENVRDRSSERIPDFIEKDAKRSSKTNEPYCAVRSLGDECVEIRNSIGKSHSFRYASETTSISSQENQMPSLPAIVGISEPLLESWEVNYRRNVSDRHDFSKRVSARNYNILHGTPEATYDSLPSTDSSYLDSLKNDVNEDRKLFTNSVHITIDSHKRDSDISQIEAKIDDIISSPKPVLSSILKSSSLDSVKSSPEKPVDDRRKTISVDCDLSHGGKVINKSKDLKVETESFISVTHINKESTEPVVVTKTETVNKINKVEEKPQKSMKPGVPEFLNIQLNRVDAKPATNIVLTANVTPKKIDSPQADKDVEATEIKSARKESVTSKSDVDNVDKTPDTPSPIGSRKTSLGTPQSPSTPKNFFKRKAMSVELQDRPEKPRTNSISTDGSSEKIFDNISMDRKSHSSFGSKSSIQSNDSSEAKTPDRQEDVVVFRKKPVILAKEFRNSDRRNDDEPELMKVFARRSLKIKDTEADNLAQEIADSKHSKDDINDDISANRSKLLKNEFNASIKSRDSDKENEEISKEPGEERKSVDIAARVSQFGAHYQRSISISNVPQPKRESAPYRSEINRYKKEVSDSTPEKRLRNRTFPDPSNDREDIKSIGKTDYRAETLTKRQWQRRDDEGFRRSEDGFRKSEEVFRKSEEVLRKSEERNSAGEREEPKEKAADEHSRDRESPQFPGIVRMRAEWERRARQALSK